MRGVLKLYGARQQVQARGVLRQRPFEQCEVESREVLRDINERVVGNTIEAHVGVAQGHVQIDQHGAIALLLSQDATEIDRQAGRAYTACGAANSDDMTRSTAAVAGS